MVVLKRGINPKTGRRYRIVKRAKAAAGPARRKRFRKYTGLNPSFASQMRKYNSINAEKKLIPFKNYLIGPDGDWLSHIPSIGFPGNVGSGDAGEVSGVVLQTGYYLTTNNVLLNNTVGDLCTPVGGYDIQQGSENNELDGRYGKITSSQQNIWIQMNPQSIAGTDTSTRLEGVMPHDFRLIQVKAKRSNSIAATTGPDQLAASGAIKDNLWIDTSGKEIGLTNDMGALEPFSFLVNKQKFQVLKDYKFTLCANGVYGAAAAYPAGVKQYPSSKMIKCYYPTPRGKTKWAFRDGISVSNPQPIDFNYVVHTIILARVRGSVAGYESANWSVQCNGTTAVLDL